MNTRSTAAPRELQVVRESSRAASRDFVVGKDILELLSTAMYLDPLTLLREYIQNAADSVDAAIAAGVLVGPQPGRIEIEADADSRCLTIRDNGTGIRSSEVEALLTAFGASRKRGAGMRGFRGVGRLAGLGFCQTLIFRTRSSASEPVTTLQWDCRRLRHILRDSTFKGDLREVVRQVVGIEEVDGAGYPEHFFEVELHKVVRIRNDILLNPEVISAYLEEVAPLPFADNFQFAGAIVDHLAPHVPEPTFRIFVQSATAHLTKPIVDQFQVGVSKVDEFDEVQLLEFESRDGGVAAVGWLLHHGYRGSLRYAPSIRGLRARAGGIQVGGAEIFGELFPESRFCSWTVGEIHVVDSRILPNGRRDQFEQNAALFDLHNQLVPVCRDIARRCRSSSLVRNRLKSVIRLIEEAEELIRVIQSGQISASTRKSLQQEGEKRLAQLDEMIAGEMFPANEISALRSRLKALQRKMGRVVDGAVKGRSLPGGVPKAKRAAFEEIIGLIYECSPNRLAAKALVDKLAGRLKKTYG